MATRLCLRPGAMHVIGPMGMSKDDELRKEEFGRPGVLEVGIVLGGLLERICVMRSDSAVDMLLAARDKVVACVCDESSARKRIENSILPSVFNLDYRRSQSYIRPASLRLSGFAGDVDDVGDLVPSLSTLLRISQTGVESLLVICVSTTTLATCYQYLSFIIAIAYKSRRCDE